MLFTCFFRLKTKKTAKLVAVWHRSILLIGFSIIEATWLTGGLIVFGQIPCHRHSRRSANTFQLFRKSPAAKFFKPQMVNPGVWADFWYPSRWPWVKVIKLPKQDCFYLVPTIKWGHPIATKLSRYIPLVIHLIKFWRNNLRNFFNELLCKISNAFFSSWIFYLPHLRNGWYSWCKPKRKWVNWMLRWLG